MRGLDDDDAGDPGGACATSRDAGRCDANAGVAGALTDIVDMDVDVDVDVDVNVYGTRTSRQSERSGSESEE